MTPCIGFIFGPRLLMLLIFGHVNAQVPNEAECSGFIQGRDDFVLDTEDAVKSGANLISSPTVNVVEECKSHCCQDPKCNLALIENGAEEGSVKTCFLFNCLYKKEFVCRFVSKLGFRTYILDSVYEDYLGEPETTRDDHDKFPIAKTGQDVVVQPNENVTLNGIESWDDEPITDFQWSLLTGNQSVVFTKTQYKDQVILSSLYPGMYVFQLKVTDSIGQTSTDQVSVLVLTPEQSDSHCLIPKKVGPCRGSFLRWHYNAASKSCENFTFGGCKGNHNNYLSQQECSDACEGVPERGTRGIHPEAEDCGSPCDPGQFTCGNGCCLEPGLECDTMSHCSDGSDEVACDSLNQTFSRLLRLTVDKHKAQCTEPPRTGPCRASHTHWYYDPIKTKCHRFTYGGCDGNSNNFEVEDKCSATCEGVNENDLFVRSNFKRQENEEESRSGSVAVAVVLGVAIMALLAVLGYCFLKNRKRRAQHQPVATSIPSDTPVYNSTTKPI
ncbi:kunitz-type protease inhibitor 1 isoform X2 [Esox lucius]|uniref:kunitz-type protease inhibitor 1 isoform X2 n=1 Tax=Esox lucius TaxID=8010 RepID=UPI000576EBFA|nr:kunitz-type protease inhibitor 1 isoform X2 [Esox lucius]